MINHLKLSIIIFGIKNVLEFSKFCFSFPVFMPSQSPWLSCQLFISLHHKAVQSSFKLSSMLCTVRKSDAYARCKRHISRISFHLSFEWLTRFHLILIKYHLPNVDFSGKSIIPQKCSRKSFALAM